MTDSRFVQYLALKADPAWRRMPEAERRRGRAEFAEELEHAEGTQTFAYSTLGLKTDDPSPLDGKAFSLKQTRAVYDMIYRPAETALLKSAKRSGCKTANGLGMLLHQGAKAFEIWTGKPAPLAVMRRALEQNIYGR